MTRRITAICCFVFAVFILLSGCVNREVGEENTEQDIVNVFDNNLEDRLVVYATHPEPMLKRVADAFTEKTGVLVEYVSLKGDLTDRMREEKDIAKADVMYGGSSTLYIALTNEDLLEAYVPSWSKDLHSDFVDSKSYWHGVMKTPIVIFYREDLLGDAPIPTSWKDLSKPQYQGLIISRDSNSSSQEATIVSLLSYFEKMHSFDEGISWLKDLDNNTKNYYPNNESHFKAFVAKEAPIGYGVLSAVIESKIKDRIPFSTVNPEEGGLHGAKALDYSQFGARHCFVLDSGGDPGQIIIQGPAQDKINFKVKGRAAHAGVAPEEGISAIVIAAEAIANMKLLRIDSETTANIGRIEGGTVTNIVAEEVYVTSEARSLVDSKLEAQSKHMIDCFEKAAQKFGGSVEVEHHRMYSSFQVNADDEIVKNAFTACKNVGLNPFTQATGGGSDTNIINGKGITAINLGIGERKAHSLDEHLYVKDLVKVSELVLEIISLYK